MLVYSNGRGEQRLLLLMSLKELKVQKVNIAFASISEFHRRFEFLKTKRVFSLNKT